MPVEFVAFQTPGGQGSQERAVLARSHVHTHYLTLALDVHRSQPMSCSDSWCMLRRNRSEPQVADQAITGPRGVN